MPCPIKGRAFFLLHTARIRRLSTAPCPIRRARRVVFSAAAPSSLLGRRPAIRRAPAASIPLSSLSLVLARARCHLRRGRAPVPPYVAPDNAGPMPYTVGHAATCAPTGGAARAPAPCARAPRGLRPCLVRKNFKDFLVTSNFWSHA